MTFLTSFIYFEIESSFETLVSFESVNKETFVKYVDRKIMNNDS
jgi:hypothetical protein